MTLIKKLKNKLSMPIIIILITFFTKIINFIKEILLANKFGTSSELDAFIIATTVPVVITGLLASAINTSLIPIFSKLESDENRYSLMNKIISILILVMGSITVISIINPNIFLKMIISNQDIKLYSLTSELFRINSINILIITVMYAYIALLNIKGNLIVATIIGFVMQIPTSIYLIFIEQPTVAGLSIINVLSIGIQFFIVIIYLKKINYKGRFDFRLKDENVKEVLKFSGPIFLSNGVHQLNTIVDNFQASKLGSGTIASFNYANRLNGIIVSLLVQPIILITYPVIANLANLENKEKFFERSYEVLVFLAIFMIPFSVGGLIFSKEIVTLIYAGGSFTSESIELTSKIMFFSSVSIFFLAIKELIIRMFYSLSQVTFVTKVSIFAIGINILLNILLTPLWGAAGIVIATTISAIVFVLISGYELRKKGFRYNLIFIKINIKLLVFSAVSILIPKLTITSDVNYMFLLNIIIAVSIYMTFIYIFGKKEFEIMKKVLLNNNL